jgi:thiol-disulfide isomerase/thioredoxin
LKGETEGSVSENMYRKIRDAVVPTLPFLAVVALFPACGGPAMPVSEPHESLNATMRAVAALRIEQNPPEETAQVPMPGMVTVVDFWATWCKPCIDSMDELEALWQRVDRSRVAVVGVAIDEEASAAQQKVAELGVTFPMVYDSAAVLDETYRVGRRVPSTFVLDAEGRVRFFVGGAKDEAERRKQIARLEQAIEAILTEMR